VLIAAIVKSTLGACRFILVPGADPQPLICRFTTPLKTDRARALLANSITLTPGTITVSLEDGEFTVHCLDRSMAEGLDSSRFVQLLLRLEEVSG
jgi:multicomponent Na+:H+ antiporter subunit E